MRRLRLGHTRVEGEGLKHLEGALTALVDSDSQNTPINDQAAPALAESPAPTVAWCIITIADDWFFLANLIGLKNLRVLDSERLRHEPQDLAAMTELRLDGRFTDKALPQLAAVKSRFSG